MTNEMFRKLSEGYLNEQKEIQSTIPDKESTLEKLKSSVANIQEIQIHYRYIGLLDDVIKETVSEESKSVA